MADGTARYSLFFFFTYPSVNKMNLTGGSPTTLPSGKVSLDEHPKIFCAGDVHGDFLALLRVLKMTGVARVLDHVMAAVEICPADQIGRKINPLAADEMRSIAWTGGRNALLLLGDVLDNRRGGKDDPYGVCGFAGTQTQMMELLQQLATTARRAGGKLVWVLGNHDCGNAMGGNRHFCERYAPQWHTRPGTTGDKVPSVYATCNAHGFSDDHVRHVQDALLKMRSVAVVNIHSPSTGHSVIALHGGITKTSMTFLTSRVMGKYRLRKQDSPDVNITRLNSLFHDAHSGDPAATQIVNHHSDKMPTWCRPSSIEDPHTFEALFGTTRMIKAHDVQERGANCGMGHQRKTSGTAAMMNNELCRVDAGMSRCFAKYVPRRNIAFVELWVDSADLMRRVHNYTYD